jgi:hypothetical protein
VLLSTQLFAPADRRPIPLPPEVSYSPRLRRQLLELPDGSTSIFRFTRSFTNYGGFARYLGALFLPDCQTGTQYVPVDRLQSRAFIGLHSGSVQYNANNLFNGAA